MSKSLHTFLLSCLLFVGLLLTAQSSLAAPTEDQEPSLKEIAGQLKQYKTQIDNIKQQVSQTNTDSRLIKLFDTTQKLGVEVDSLTALLQPMHDKVQAQLQVLGPAPETAAGNETASVSRQRNALNSDKKQIDEAISTSQNLQTNIRALGIQINDLRRTYFKSQLASNSGSMLSATFWLQEADTQAVDIQRFNAFGEQLLETWQAAWEPELFWGTFWLFVAAAAIVFAGCYLIERLLVWIAITWLPDGRLRRSFNTLASTLVTMFTIALALSIVKSAFSRGTEFSPQVNDFVDGFVQLAVFCSLIYGAGRAFLSLNRPSWRLVQLDDSVAESVRYFPPLLAILGLLIGCLDLINNTIGASLGTTIRANGLIAAVMASVLLTMMLRVQHAHRRLEKNGEPAEKRSRIDALVCLLVMLASLAILASLLVGYIAFARYLTYQVIWFGMVLVAFYYLVTFATDFFAAVFSPHTAPGQAMKKSLRFKDRHLEQLAVVFTAFTKCALILMTIIALFNGTFGTTTPSLLISKLVTILSGDGLKQLHIVPGNLLNAVLCLVIGLYILRVTQRWLSQELLPKTIADIGIRASLITLFTNVGYVLLILITLAALGIQWNNLAWIVSALSVGIGFGLQEIVKNFISGLILLTERPVKVGDMIGIGGIEGDVRRINVRATEIQLSDRSTMIVPNSQLISQNVRNATMGNAQGVVTIALTFPTNIDPELVRDLLLSAYQDYEVILPTPAPYVRFSQLGPEGIILSVTGYVASPRMVGSSKSELLFNILKLLRKNEVNLSSPQEVVFMKQRAKALDDDDEFSS
ncbi:MULTISPECIES: DUF3772 domain-containing protein [Enterobacteriaceae]|uniref:DUF3772 domain-containing protein n=1 Tax=Enterobacteriaceae TaxID=543 RepID=UPI000272B267|nr:DUF3772 domain-containing protein [Enterobacter sp. Ag1]EJF33134.1 mechanosensitive ion channel protein MscS [Enterobacter sp. Ag1]